MVSIIYILSGNKDFTMHRKYLYDRNRGIFAVTLQFNGKCVILSNGKLTRMGFVIYGRMVMNKMSCFERVKNAKMLKEKYLNERGFDYVGFCIALACISLFVWSFSAGAEAGIAQIVHVLAASGGVAALCGLVINVAVGIMQQGQRLELFEKEQPGDALVLKRAESFLKQLKQALE